MLELNKLTTEARNPGTAGLDTMTPLEIRESVYPLSWKAQMQKVIKEAGFGSLE